MTSCINMNGLTPKITRQVLPPNMNLSTLRTHVWKGGNDIVLYYRLKEGVHHTLPWASTGQDEGAGSNGERKKATGGGEEN